MKFNNKKIVTLIVAMMLVASMVCGTVGCGGSNQQAGNAVQNTEVQDTEIQKVEESQVTILGEGAMQFAFTVIDKEGNETAFEIHNKLDIFLTAFILEIWL